MHFTDTEIAEEAKRLLEKLKHVGWDENDCLLHAPLTLEINQLKKEQDAIILAHSYQTPDIVYGVADFVGDSYGLSVQAIEQECKKIIFCSVHFMGETAKLLNPNKEVLVPKVSGCSLAESITAEDVIEMRRKHPNAAVVCYVNTTAEVKAECDVCCTSSNAHQIIEALPEQDIIFVPDELMAKNLQKNTSKNIIPWNGVCIVHEQFKEESIDAIREKYGEVEIIAHPECTPGVVDKVDFAGGTGQMIKHVAETDKENYMLVTECGLADRIRAEYPRKNIVGTCNLCPYMKEIQLRDVLRALADPSEEQMVRIDEDVAERARECLEKMFEITNSAYSL